MSNEQLAEVLSGNDWVHKHVCEAARRLREYATKLAEVERERDDWREASHKNGEAMAGYQARAITAEEKLKAAAERAERAEAAMHKLLSVVDYPDNGVHYCRWCRGGTSNNWQHDPGCRYVERTKRIDEARAAARAAASLIPTIEPQSCYPFSTETCNRPGCTCRREKEDAPRSPAPAAAPAPPPDAGGAS